MDMQKIQHLLDNLQVWEQQNTLLAHVVTKRVSEVAKLRIAIQRIIASHMPDYHKDKEIKALLQKMKPVFEERKE